MTEFGFGMVTAGLVLVPFIVRFRKERDHLRRLSANAIVSARHEDILDVERETVWARGQTERMRRARAERDVASDELIKERVASGHKVYTERNEPWYDDDPHAIDCECADCD